MAISGDKFLVGAPLSDASVSVPLAPQAAEQGAVFFFINSFAPTAADVSVGGRIFDAEGCAIRNAAVYLMLVNGQTLTARSSSFGYYRFDEIGAGQTVIVSVSSKSYSFAPQVLTLIEDVTNVDFVAQ